MSRTKRIWHSCKSWIRQDHSLLELGEPVWKYDSMRFWGYHEQKWIRQKERRMIRAHHRTMFAHDRYDDVINCRNWIGEYFD